MGGVSIASMTVAAAVIDQQDMRRRIIRSGQLRNSTIRLKGTRSNIVRLALSHSSTSNRVRSRSRRIAAVAMTSITRTSNVYRMLFLLPGVRQQARPELSMSIFDIEGVHWNVSVAREAR